MSFSTSGPIGYRLYGDRSAASGEQPYQTLELRSRYFRRLITGSPSAGFRYQIVHETAPTPLDNVLIQLPLRELHDPVSFQIYVAQLLSSLSIREVIARQIASYVFQMAAGDTEMNFHIVADVNYIQLTWMEMETVHGWSNGAALVEEAPPARRGVPESAMERLRMEKLEENGEILGDCCSICLEEINCKEREVIKVLCGHVYHQSCIFKWLHNSNSCPLCRRPLSLED